LISLHSLPSQTTKLEKLQDAERKRIVDEATHLERHKASAQRQESERVSAKVRAEAEDFYKQGKREADRAAKARRTVEIDYAALPTLTIENKELVNLVADLRAQLKEKEHKLLACNRSGETLLAEHDSQLKEQVGVHRKKEKDLRYKCNDAEWAQKEAEDREREATLSLKIHTPPKALEGNPERLAKKQAVFQMGQAQELERAFQNLDDFDDGMEVEVQEEEEEEEEEEGVVYTALMGTFGKNYRISKKGAMTLDVRQLAMEMSANMSNRKCEYFYGKMLDILPCKFPKRCYLSREYFRDKLRELNPIALTCSGLDLAHAQDWCSASGDGTADKKLMHGVVEFFSHVLDIVDFDGEARAISAGGVLKSFGLTAQEEADTCFALIEILRWLVEFAIKLFAKRHPKLKDHSSCSLPWQPCPPVAF
jgi:hypothetical protein